MSISKQELRKRFNIWLGGAFDCQNKQGQLDRTNRWLLCWQGTEPIEECFDCACCLSDVEERGCGCICHERITQLVDFFYRQLVENK